MQTKKKIELKRNAQGLPTGVQKMKIPLKTKLNVIDNGIQSKIRPSDKELRKRLEERKKTKQRKHTGLPLNIRLKLITKSKPPPQQFDLRDINCKSNGLCKNDECNRCYENSLASMSKYALKHWSGENKIRPRDLSKGTSIECWFDCDNYIKCGSCENCKNSKKCENLKKCEHCYLRKPSELLRSSTSKKSKGGPTTLTEQELAVKKFMCPGPSCTHLELCNDGDCFRGSFANEINKIKSQYWSNHIVDGIRINGEWNPRNVYPAGKVFVWFDCDKCNHVFESTMNDISAGKWCPYCNTNGGGQRKLCEARDCKWCYENSFASHEKAKYWSAKNADLPHRVPLNHNGKCWFNCDTCKYEFEGCPRNINQLNTWCPNCKNKTEVKLYNWLISNFKEIPLRNKNVEWCRGETSNVCLPFDFIFESTKLIIELDGNQHLMQVSNWQSPEERQEVDVYKMQCALKNEYSIIRILQEDVRYDRNNWQEKLKPLIKKNDKPIVTYIQDNNQYASHIEKMHG